MSQNPKEGISNTGIQGQILECMSTRHNLLEGEITPIDRAEMSQQLGSHDEIHCILAKFPVNNTAANTISALELIAIAVRLHAL
jgi:hypothetical protein